MQCNLNIRWYWMVVFPFRRRTYTKNTRTFVRHGQMGTVSTEPLALHISSPCSMTAKSFRSECHKWVVFYHFDLSIHRSCLFLRVIQYVSVCSGSKQLHLKVNWTWLKPASPSSPSKTFIIMWVSTVSIIYCKHTTWNEAITWGEEYWGDK